jgi:metal-responsive CopG/Arc/MetJ family transcriptional regulator
MDEHLHRKLKIALKKRGYGSISEWVREMARSMVKEAELGSTTSKSG